MIYFQQKESAAGQYISQYRIIETLKQKKRIFLCEGPRGNKVVLKPALNADVINRYRDLRVQMQAGGDTFRLLYLPDYIESIGGFDVFEFVEGQKKPWSERPNDPSFGGRSIAPELVLPILDLSVELDRLNVRSDFYWQNFIFMPCGRIALIDWERITPCKDSSQRLAYLYCLMFGNREWQLRLVDEAKRRNLVTYDGFRRHVIDSARQFQLHWAKEPALNQIMSETIQELSNDYRYNAVWNAVDLPAILANSGYHVFEDLGQIRTLDSQIDAQGKLASLALDRLGIRGKKLLDVGCNYGWFLKEYAKLGASPIVGIDINAKHVTVAKTLLGKVYVLPQVKVEHADVLNYAGSDFEIVISTSMFHYIADKPKFLQRLASCLAPGGVLVLETPLGSEDVDIAQKQWGKVTVYIPSKKYVERLASSEFDCVYVGKSNRPERRVFHFRKK